MTQGMTVRAGFWLLVVAAVVLAGSAAVDASYLAEQPKRHKVFYPLDEPGVDRAKAALGPALRSFLAKDMDPDVRGKPLLAGGLRFDACQNAMARQKIEGATPVASGVVRVVEVQEAGYASIKP